MSEEEEARSMASIVADAQAATKLLDRIIESARMSACSEIDRLRQDVEAWRRIAMRLEQERISWRQERDRLHREAVIHEVERFGKRSDVREDATGYRADIE